MKRAGGVLFLFLHFLVEAQVASDSLPVNLNEVVVTATRTPRLLGNVAVPASIISSKTIYQSGSLRLNDILAEQTGIAVIDNFGKGVQVQGLSSEYTLILLNGEPLIGRTGGVLDLSRVSIRGIKKIEIIKGPSSSLYGSEAMGGVINIITDEAGGRKFDLGIRYGRFNTINGSIDFSRKINKLDLQINTDYNRSEGYSLKPNAIQKTIEPFWRSTQQLILGYVFNPMLKFSLTARHNNTYIDNQIAVQNGGATIVSKGFEKNNEFNLNPTIQYKPSKKLSSTLRGYFTGFKALQELSVKNAVSGYDDQFAQSFNRIENQTDWHIREQSSFSVGGGYIAETVQSNRYDSLSSKRMNSIAYLFMQHEENINNKATVVVGFRYDANDAYASVFSPKAAFQYKLSDKISFNFSYGKGFKAPDFRQLYLNFTNVAAGSYTVFGTELAKEEVNRLQALNQIEQTTASFNAVSSLKAEVSGGLNAGLKINLPSKVDAKINLFRNDIRNMIVTDVIAYKRSGGQVFSYFNLKNALTQGVEFEAAKKLDQHLTIRSGYQFLYSADKDVLKLIKQGNVFERDMKSNQVSRMPLSNYGGLPFRSKHSANLKLTYETSTGFFSTARFVYRGKWGTNDLDGNGLINRADEYANGYLQLNLSVGYNTNKKWDVMAGIDNLFNYKDIINLPGNPGRAAYVNFQIHF
jgi:outer membrane receptor for ferrienterochelin and colicins